MAIRKNELGSKKDNCEMKEIKLKYNPFTYETQLEGLKKWNNSKLKSFMEKNRNTKIQIWIKEFFNIVEEEINSTSFSLKFIGRNEEFEDIEEEVLRLNETGYNIELSLDLIESTNENIFQKLNDFVCELKDCAPVELLNELNQKKAFEEYERAKNSEAYVSVIATMSSGKSTLINSILGEELLPSKNEACTATICKIKDVDEMKSFRARVEDLEGNEIHSWQENVSNEFLTEVNENGNKKGLNIFLEGDIPGISSQDMSLVMIDTPGPNNSQNEDHKAATYKYIKDNETNPLVLYVMNATQHGTNDDNRLLTEIADIIQKKGKQAEERFLFALNKIDAFDVDKEDVERLIENNREYLKSKGIKNPKIFPISAEFSKLKKLEIREKPLTRSQKNNLKSFKYNFMPELSEGYEGINTIKYASISAKLREELYEESKTDEDKGHLHYSGITAIEKYIDKYVSKYARTQKIKDSAMTLKQILDSNYNEYMLSHGKNKEELERVKKQIEDVESLLSDQGEEQIRLVKIKINDINADKDDFERTVIKIDEVFTNLEFEFESIESSEAKADLIVGDAIRELDSLLIQLKTDAESIIKDQLNEKANNILSSLTEYFSKMLESINLDTELTETLNGLFTAELPKAHRLIGNSSFKKSVHKGQKFSHTESDSRWYNPFSWGRKREVYVDIYEEEVRVNLSEIWENEIRPLRTSFLESIEDSFNNLDFKIISLKEEGIKNISDIEIKIKSKINELKKKIEVQSKLEQENDELNLNISKTVKYKEQLDSILVI